MARQPRRIEKEEPSQRQREHHCRELAQRGRASLKAAHSMMSPSSPHAMVIQLESS